MVKKYFYIIKKNKKINKNLRKKLTSFATKLFKYCTLLLINYVNK